MGIDDPNGGSLPGHLVAWCLSLCFKKRGSLQCMTSNKEVFSSASAACERPSKAQVLMTMMMCVRDQSEGRVYGER